MRISATVTEKASVFGPILFAGDLCAGMAQAARIGYPAVELHIRDSRAIDVKSVRGTLTASGMCLSTIGTGRAAIEDGLYFCHDDPAVRQKAIDRVKGHIDSFADLKPGVIIGIIKGKLALARDRESAVARIDDALVECCGYAQQAGITVLLEMANRYEQDYLHTAQEVVDVIKRLGAANLRLLEDTFHANIEEQSFESAFSAARGYLGHVHVADNNRRYPGGGMINFERIFGMLHSMGYDGYLAVECLPWPDSETAAQRAYDHMNAWMR